MPLLPNFSITPSPTHITTSDGRTVSLAKCRAGAAYRKHGQIMNALLTLSRYSYDVPSLRNISDTLSTYQHARLEASHTFTTCPSCYTALRTKPSSKPPKNPSFYDCNICNKRSDGTDSFRMIHHSLSLSDARSHLKEHNPELFL